MDTLGFSKVTSLFILTLIERDDGQKKQILETPTNDLNEKVRQLSA